MDASTGPDQHSARYERLLADIRLSNSDSSSLQDDLRLSAQIGQGLLAKTEELQAQLECAERGQHDALDKLAHSVRQTALLEKRLQQVVIDLEASELSNRNLLASLDQDKRNIARLSAEQAKGIGSDAKLKSLAQEKEDLRQELDAERKRAAAADARARKAMDKLAANVVKLEQLSKDEKDFRQRSAEKDQEALSKARALMTLAASAPRSPKLGEPEEDFPEVLALVQNLVAENDALRSEVNELNDLLTSAREEQSGLRSEMESRQAFLPEDEGNANATLMSETLLSDAGSERALSPAFDASANGISTSWAASSMNAHKRLSTFSNSSMSDYGAVHPTYAHQHYPTENASNGRKRGSLRRITPGPRMHGRRAHSVDVSAMSSENDGDLPVFPRPLRTQGSAPHSRQESRNNPPPFSPLRDAIEDNTSGSEPVSPGTNMPAAPSGLSLSSPTRRKMLSLSRGDSADAAIQTDATQSSPALLPPYAGAFYNSQSTPDLSGSEGFEALHESRTASLVLLMEHVAKLLARIKSADIASLESRFKKQRLAGDVGHLSRATVKEISADIDSLRDFFRKVLEQEQRVRPHGTEHDSLVSKRDFVNLVKLERDTFLELARLRGLVNRIQLEPSLATRLAELDKEDVNLADIAPSFGGGLLAPLARFFAPASSPVSPEAAVVKASAPRQEATSAIAPTLVNVEFGKSGAIRRAVSIAPQAEGAAAGSGYGANRGLSGIFAGGKSTKAGQAKSGRDRWQSMAREDMPPLPQPGRLLERQLRPRGLSDSSIRTGFEDRPANPGDRVLTPAALALSSQSGAAAGSVSAVETSTSREAILEALSARVNSFRTGASAAPVAQAAAHPIGIAGSLPVAEPAIKGESYGTSSTNGGLWNGLSAWASKTAFTTPNLEERAVPALKRRGNV